MKSEQVRENGLVNFGEAIAALYERDGRVKLEVVENPPVVEVLPWKEVYCADASLPTYELRFVTHWQGDEWTDALQVNFFEVSDLDFRELLEARIEMTLLCLADKMNYEGKIRFDGSCVEGPR